MNFRDVEVKVNASKVDNRDGFSLVLLRDSRQDKKKNIWVKSAYPNTRFAGDAQNKIDDLIDAIDNADTFDDGNSKGVFIILKSVSFTNEPYEREGTKIYPRQLTVWDWEFAERKLNGSNSLNNTKNLANDLSLNDEGDIPF